MFVKGFQKIFKNFSNFHFLKFRATGLTKYSPTIRLATTSLLQLSEWLPLELIWNKFFATPGSLVLRLDRLVFFGNSSSPFSNSLSSSYRRPLCLSHSSLPQPLVLFNWPSMPYMIPKFPSTTVPPTTTNTTLARLWYPLALPKRWH